MQNETDSGLYEDDDSSIDHEDNDSTDDEVVDQPAAKKASSNLMYYGAIAVVLLISGYMLAKPYLNKPASRSDELPVTPVAEVKAHEPTAIVNVAGAPSPQPIQQAAAPAVASAPPDVAPVEPAKPVAPEKGETPVSNAPAIAPETDISAAMPHAPADRHLANADNKIKERVLALEKDLATLRASISTRAKDPATSRPSVNKDNKASKANKAKSAKQKTIADKIVSRELEIQAIVSGRAWLIDKADSSRSFTVEVGDTLPGLGKVTGIDTANGVVNTSSGTLIK